MSGSSAVYLIIIVCLIMGIVYYAGTMYVETHKNLSEKYKGKTMTIMRIGLSRVLSKLANTIYNDETPK